MEETWVKGMGVRGGGGRGRPFGVFKSVNAVMHQVLPPQSLQSIDTSDLRVG